MDHRDLTIWQRSRSLCTEVYKLTDLLPSNEKYGLVSQLQRCAVSIPSNIAEGYRRNSPKDFMRFLSIANGSIAELDTQLDIVSEVYSIRVAELQNEVIEIHKMIASFQRRLQTKLHS